MCGYSASGRTLVMVMPTPALASGPSVVNISACRSIAHARHAQSPSERSSAFVDGRRSPAISAWARERPDINVQPAMRLTHFVKRQFSVSKLGGDLSEVRRSDDTARQDVDYPIRSVIVVQQAEQGGAVEYDLASYAPPHAGAPRSVRQPSRRLRTHTCSGSREAGHLHAFGDQSSFISRTHSYLGSAR